MKQEVDLDAYFARISYSGGREANLETLNRILYLHNEHIPFENLDVVLHKSVSLRPQDVDDKIIRRKRGGYCFEQNTLLMRVLLRMGFK
eukprot:g80155.t1